MMTHNGVEKRSKMMEKVAKRRPQRMDNEKKKEAKTARPASRPA